MAQNLAKIKALQQAVKETGKDLTKPSAGGGDYEPPKVGATRLRFVKYIETGIHTTTFKGAQKTKPRAELTFELSGPNHPAKELEDGRKIPYLITLKEVIGTTPKNGYIKLFKLMAQEYPGSTSFIDMLGKAFRGDVSHFTFKGTSGDVTIAQLKGDSGYSIRGVSYEDPETGELKKLAVDAPITPLTAFLWDYADVEDWDAIFIDGEYDDGATKNKLQEKIKSAENFVGSPIYEALIEAGREAETVVSEQQKPEEDGPADEAEEPVVQEGPKKAPASPKATPKMETKATPPAEEKTAPKAAKPAAKSVTANKGKPAPKATEPDVDDGDPLAGL